MASWVRSLIEIVIGGIETGGIYILMAVGLSLLYGVTKIFNYSYGSLLTIGGYIAWFFISGIAGFHYGIATIFVIPIMFFIGIGIEKGLLQPLRRKTDWEINAVIVTLGLALMLNSLILIIFGPLIKTLPPIIQGNLKIGGFVFSNYRLTMLGMTILIMILLQIFLTKTKIGMAMRAVAQDSLGAQIVGIPINRLFGYTFAISTVLAGISGIFLGSTYFLSPDGGWLFFVRAFIIIALGGIGSLKGAFVAALILGLVESAVTYQLGPIWVMPVWFFVLIIILIIRPKGLFGIR